ncbi:aromatic alcohol reductase [Aspergillus clavatus NRRL 1]|uniref:Isoflavone reductase family protein n=1 Tax=Aspergillus clavatus (strain ATCC 1007 / CBS 513.65 / DSM 816 / NCTC 3887 / NRRL 1 / QM 1276 / 107) TaxID=344612 RepID=A1C4G9_ASPCL|nr:isoflavone reductase family protein [Aspergillus clavatus NRRL 1]EAW15309.1 isoflavone reductase family protein [Aspergillus clavatus NRRL 1]
MTITETKVIIIGAGGLLGPHIVSALDTHPRFAVSILARKSSQSIFPSHLPVYRIADSYPEPELLKAFQGHDVVISTITAQGTGTQQQKAFIDAAVKAGVRRFIPSEFVPDMRNEKALELLPAFVKPKLEVIDYLKSKEKEGLQWTAFVTGLFVDLVIGPFLGYSLTERRATLLNDGLDRWSGTTCATTALAVRNALLHPQLTINKRLFIASVTVTQREILAALERATATKWQVTYVDAEDEKDAAFRELWNGNPRGIKKLIKHMACVEGYSGNYLQLEKSANNLLSLPSESLDEIVARVVGRI